MTRTPRRSRSPALLSENLAAAGQAGLSRDPPTEAPVASGIGTSGKPQRGRPRSSRSVPTPSASSSTIKSEGPSALEAAVLPAIDSSAGTKKEKKTPQFHKVKRRGEWVLEEGPPIEPPRWQDVQTAMKTEDAIQVRDADMAKFFARGESLGGTEDGSNGQPKTKRRKKTSQDSADGRQKDRGRKAVKHESDEVATGTALPTLERQVALLGGASMQDASVLEEASQLGEGDEPAIDCDTTQSQQPMITSVSRENSVRHEPKRSQSAYAAAGIRPICPAAAPPEGESCPEEISSSAESKTQRDLEGGATPMTVARSRYRPVLKKQAEGPEPVARDDLQSLAAKVETTLPKGAGDGHLLSLPPMYQALVLHRPSKTCKTPYLADIRLIDGPADEVYMAHAPSLGCGGLVDPGAIIHVTPAANGKTQSKYVVQLSIQSEADGTCHMIGLHPQTANLLARALLEKQHVFSDVKEVAKEVKIGASRFDYIVTHNDGSCTIVEVKNVPIAAHCDGNKRERKKKLEAMAETLKPYEKFAVFPEGYRKKASDPISPRALKHVQELQEVAQGRRMRSCLLFVVQRIDANRLRIARDDPIYRAAVEEAQRQGVILKAFSIRWEEEHAHVHREVPFDWEGDIVPESPPKKKEKVRKRARTGQAEGEGARTAEAAEEGPLKGQVKKLRKKRIRRAENSTSEEPKPDKQVVGPLEGDKSRRKRKAKGSMDVAGEEKVTKEAQASLDALEKMIAGTQDRQSKAGKMNRRKAA